MAPIAILMGRLMSYINMQVLNFRIGESRFLWFLEMVTAVLSAIALTHIKLKPSKNIIYKESFGIYKTIFTVFFLNIIMLAGLFTPLLYVESRYLIGGMNVISTQEQEALSLLSEFLDQNPRTIVLTPSDKSWLVLNYAGAIRSKYTSLLLFSAQNPDQALNMLYLWREKGFEHVLLYLHNRDLAINGIEETYVWKQIVVNKIPLFRNREVQIYDMRKVTYPIRNSNTLLIIPHLYASVPSLSNLSGWRPFGGIWHPLEGGDVNGSLKGPYGEGILIAEGMKFSDGIMQVNIKLKKDGQQEGLVFRGLDKNNFYKYIFEDNVNSLSLYKKVNGIYILINRVPFKPEIDRWYTLKVIAEGTIFEFYLDEKFIFSAEDKEFSAGYFNGLFLRRIEPFVIFSKFTIVDISTTNVPLSINTAYSLLSLGGYNYTVAPELEDKLASDASTFLFPIDPKDDRYDSIEKYMHYVRQGATLLILNTNGYNELSKQFFQEWNGTTLVYDWIIDNQTRITNINAKILTPAHNVKVSRYYPGTENKVAFSLYTSVGKGQVIYVNIFPILSSIEFKPNKEIALLWLGKAIGNIGFNISKYDRQEISDIQKKLIFRESHLEGIAKIFTSSLLIQEPFACSITFSNGSQFMIPSETMSAKTISNTYFEIVVENYRIDRTFGPYAIVTVADNVKLVPSGGRTEISLLRQDDVFFNFVLDENESISLQTDTKLELYLLSPHFDVRGILTFDNTYYKTPNFYTINQRLSINGSAKFNIYSSDNFKVIDEVQLFGSVVRTPPLIQYDETSVFDLNMPFRLFLITTPVVITFVILFMHFRGLRKTDYQKESNSRSNDYTKN